MYSKALVVVTLNWLALSWGFLQGQMAGMIAALQKKEDGIDLSEGQIALLGAFLNLFNIVGYFFLAVIGEKFGRRWSLIIISLPLFINWIVLFYAKTFVALLLSRFLAGVSNGPLWVLSAAGTSEYISYKSRALCLNMVLMVVPSFGIGLGHVLGALFHWRTTALIGIVLTSVHVILPYFWVESPHWLASKGRFEECERIFRKLHGNKSNNERELLLLIKLETKKQKAANEMNTNNTCRILLQLFKKKYFWHLMVMSGVIFAYYAAAGRVVFTNLATVILEEMTGTSDVLLYTLVVDGFIFVGTCIACFLIKKMSIRALLFSSGLAANGILIALSVSLYFKNNEVYFQWINVLLLAIYFIVINAGPYPILDVLMGEIFPLEIKLYCFFLSAPLLLGTVFLCLLTLPYIVSVMGYHGLFLLNTGIMFVCLAYLYARLPETKGKTLQEIEVYFKTNSFDVDQVLNPSEQIKTLI
ncbi:facilitated trehalose transporter Tret1-like [Maniola jurtina]|uniref:facilitated trehalose transporter Tret1-like n=1 Tax=Maniola jurtina TaxID=191418 RepID=UPI001E688504|nr:facilitated trehalose transporter Tret1-like [Maniola jurtina]